MRLGRWDCQVKKGTIADSGYTKYHAYDDAAKRIVSERHRHRYEFNDTFKGF